MPRPNKMPSRVDNLENRVFNADEKADSRTQLIDSDVSFITISADRSVLADITDREVCKLRVWISENGTDFEPKGGINFVGGEHRGRNGLVFPYSQYRFDIPPGKYRYIKVNLEAKARTRLGIDCDQFA